MADKNTKTKDNSSMKVFRVISVIICVILLIALLVFLLFFILSLFEETMCLVYGDTIIYEENTGLELKSRKTCDFYILYADSFGSTAADDATVQILPNVPDSYADFEFEASFGPVLYSKAGDLSAAFTDSDSGVIEVGSDGSFEIRINYSDVNDVLQCVYGEEITVENEPDAAAAAWFKIVVTGADDAVIEVPFTIKTTSADYTDPVYSDPVYSDIILDKTYIIF